VRQQAQRSPSGELRVPSRFRRRAAAALVTWTMAAGSCEWMTIWTFFSRPRRTARNGRSRSLGCCSRSLLTSPVARLPPILCCLDRWADARAASGSGNKCAGEQLRAQLVWVRTGQPVGHDLEERRPHRFVDLSCYVGCLFFGKSSHAGFTRRADQECRGRRARSVSTGGEGGATVGESLHAEGSVLRSRRRDPTRCEVA
jgi:hypothetical protein